MSKLQNLFDNNAEWAKSIKQEDPSFFDRLAKGQTPEYLWIGCSDSRIPVNQLVQLGPGEIFVHRNIANVVVHTDLNSLSVIQYAVQVLKVKQIIICGHYGCGGVKASMEEQDHGIIDNWLRHIKDVKRFNEDKFDGLDEQKKFDLLCELNVKEQVKNVSENPVVQNEMKERDLAIHGLIFNLEDGLLKNLDISLP